MMAELLDLTSATFRTTTGKACGTALRMATRITKRKEGLLIPRNLNRCSQVVETYLQPDVKIINVDYNAKTGRICLRQPEGEAYGQGSGSVLVMNPNFFGIIEEKAQEI